MTLEEHRLVFTVIAGILVLLTVSPAVNRFLVLPRTEFFSEFWLLGPDHKAEGYPFNITSGGECRMFLGIGNRLGYAAYYKVEVKLRNQTQSAPDSFNRTFSSLPALYEVRAFVADESTWEIPLAFSLDYEYDQPGSLVRVYGIVLNNVTLPIEGFIATWDSENGGFFGNLFFELWVYSDEAGAFQYHERFVGIWLNMTAT
jgi:hypothetical protein